MKVVEKNEKKKNFASFIFFFFFLSFFPSLQFQARNQSIPKIIFEFMISII